MSEQQPRALLLAEALVAGSLLADNDKWANTLIEAQAELRRLHEMQTEQLCFRVFLASDERPLRESHAKRLFGRACYHAVIRLDWDACPPGSWRYRAWLWLLPWAGYYAFAPQGAKGAEE